MTDVLFSHRKHAVWNGCEVCHPEIFAPGAQRYTMLEISAGEACGVCHGKVAFSLRECERCHLARK
jgi:c(7)-type cytochrome triheme protein